jgi:hypothetical protein
VSFFLGNKLLPDLLYARQLIFHPWCPKTPPSILCMHFNKAEGREKREPMSWNVDKIFFWFQMSISHGHRKRVQMLEISYWLTTEEVIIIHSCMNNLLLIDPSFNCVGGPPSFWNSMLGLAVQSNPHSSRKGAK